MAQQEPVRTSLTGATLVRLLDALIDPRLRVREARANFAEGLVQWVGWADAIALSAALERQPALPVRSGEVPDLMGERDSARANLLKILLREVDATDADMVYSLFRRRYVALQQAMEDTVGALRERVRSAAAARSNELARLCAVDTVMEQALSAPERRLLGTIPTILERYCRRLRADYAEGDNKWVDLFRPDMRMLLLAELDLRLQPVEGLIEALNDNG